MEDGESVGLRVSQDQSVTDVEITTRVKGVIQKSGPMMELLIEVY